MLFRFKTIRWAVIVLLALPVVALADPATLTTLYWVSQVALAGLTAAASYAFNVAARALAPKAKPIETSRQDIRLNTSREGEPIRRFYGRFAAGGHVIYAGHPPTRNTEATGSGKRRTTGADYYSASFGVAVCLNDFNNVLGVSAVYLNNQLKYPDDPEMLPPLDGTNSIIQGVAGGTRAWGGGARRFQIILGNEDASDICEWYNNDMIAKGLGLYGVPAHRGLVTLWWDDLDLRPYYNQLPQVLVEVQMTDGTFREIIVAEAELAGLDPDTQVDVSGVSVGYAIPGMFGDGPVAPKQLFEAMSFVSRFAIVEADGVQKAFNLPTTSSATVPAADLGAYAGGIEDGGEKPAKTSLTMEQPEGLPMRVEVSYFDGANSYEQASRGYSRQSGGAKSTQQVYLPMTIAADQARYIASRVIAEAYAEGDRWKGVLLPKYAEYHPGDTITVPEPDGTFIDIRIERMVFEPGGPVEVNGVRVLRLTGGGTPSEDPHAEPTDPPPATVVDCAWVQSCCPPLIDDHDGYAGLYWGAVPKTIPDVLQRPWGGATLYMNKCGSDEDFQKYEAVARTNTAATLGRAVTVLADASGLDTTNEVDIHLPYGAGDVAIVGVLDDAFTKTTVVNLCIMGKEILQFRDVEDVSDEYGGDPGDGTHFRLSHLKRGLRGTEHMTGTHLDNEAFMMWSIYSCIRVPLNIDEQQLSWSYRCLSDGQELDDILPMFFLLEHDGETQLKDDA